MKKQIILVGCMGCGKSSVGKALSKELHYELVDIDALIEQQQGRSISTIFEQEGETYFRTLERECFHSVLEQKEQVVISVGGGLPTMKENQILLEQHEGVIYLKTTVDTLWERVRYNTKRPLLQTPNPKETLNTLLEQREEIYEKVASYMVETDGKSVREITREIVGELKN